MALSWIYVLWGDVGVIAGLFFGLKAAVLAVVVEAVLRVGRRALKSRIAIAIAGAAFVALFFFAIPFPVVVLAAAAIGFTADRLGFPVGNRASHGPSGPDAADAGLLGDEVPAHARPDLGRAVRIAAVWLFLWLAPVALLFLFLGPQDVFTRLAVFFSEVAVVSFGGAYAVLAYVAQQAVENYHWLRPGEMLAGLGMAETTPGPLIMVVQHVGFLAGYRSPDALPPLLAGTLAGLLVTWVTFTPCFLWVFLGAPYVEALRGVRALNAALSAVTAAVVGVILNLAVWFGMHVVFRQMVPWHGYGLSLDTAGANQPRPVRDRARDRRRRGAVPPEGGRYLYPSRLLPCRGGSPARLGSRPVISRADDCKWKGSTALSRLEKTGLCSASTQASRSRTKIRTDIGLLGLDGIMEQEVALAV